MPTTSAFLRSLFDQAFNQGNLAVVDELVSVASSTHIPSWGIPASRLGLKQMIANLRSAFPDLHCTVDNEISEGDKIAAHWTMRGTHNGMYFGNPPTGKQVSSMGFIFARIVEGKSVENWISIDQMGLLQQLGVVPPSRGWI
jgi:predicted ester cyclase